MLLHPRLGLVQSQGSVCRTKKIWLTDSDGGGDHCSESSLFSKFGGRGGVIYCGSTPSIQMIGMCADCIGRPTKFHGEVPAPVTQTLRTLHSTCW